MKVTYEDDNGNKTTWDYRPSKIRQTEAELMERKWGGDWDALNKAILSGSAKARRVLLWHAMRKDHPVLRWEDVPDFAMGQVSVEFDAEELADIREAIVKNKSMDDATRNDALAVLDEQIAAEPAADPKAPESS